jgi:hypothetical protein
VKSRAHAGIAVLQKAFQDGGDDAA